MATYKVKANQNLFDISLLLYGTIEGLFDLLISNDWLNMETDLKAGMELEYHDYFVINNDIVGAIETNNYIPANSERHVYLKHSKEDLVFMSKISPEQYSSSFIVSGSGEMIIDWGDNSDFESVLLDVNSKTIEHYFDNKTEDRIIKVYGDFQLMMFDTTNIGGSLLLIKPLIVDEYICRSTVGSLDGLFLFDGTYSVDLRGTKVSDLLPIGNMSLQILDLRGVYFTSPNVIDEYLQYIVDNYESRRNCTIYLTSEPTEKGMNAINIILGEKSWNEAGNWIFNINGKIYTRK